MSKLEKRITAALVSAITSADLAALIEETETAIVAADAAARAERERALDPLVSPDPVTARAAMEDAAFTRDRLNTVLPRLRQRLDEVAATEYAARWEPDFERVKARSDDLARECAERYPTALAQCVDLFERMAECNREVSRINADAPPGEHRRLLEVELTARGLERFTRDEPSIFDELKLPDWAESARMAWPPPRVFDQSMFQPVPYDRRYSPEWGLVQEEERREAREREEREAAEREAEIRARPGVKWWERPTD
jgi:hypothetical protein